MKGTPWDGWTRHARRVFRGRNGRASSCWHSAAGPTSTRISHECADFGANRAAHARASSPAVDRTISTTGVARSAILAPMATIRRMTGLDPAAAISYWLAASPAGPAPPAARAATSTADVAIVGAGFTGLWTAIALTDTDPVAAGRRPRAGDRRVRGERPERRVLPGVADPWPRERDPPLPRRGRRSSSARASPTSGRSSRSPASTGSTATSRRPAPRPSPTSRTRSRSSGRGSTRPPSSGEELEFLDRDAVQAEVHSPLWQAGLYRPPGRDVLLDPAKLVRGLARGRARSAGSRSTRARGSAGSSGGPAASGVATADDATSSTPTTSSSRPRPTRAGCAAWRACSCRSTTTSSSPIR